MEKDNIYLNAISPIDGRYGNKTAILSNYFSEYALIKYRLYVEIEYFICLASTIEELKNFNKIDKIRDIFNDFSEVDALEIKRIEKKTNHDVKAVEYYLQRKFKELGIGEYIPFIHFGITSQDINNTAQPLMLKDFNKQIYEIKMEEMLNEISLLSHQTNNIPMLSRTHGQPATPTILGKEIYVFFERISKQFANLDNYKFPAKFGGAVGNFNAHILAYPDIDWFSFAKKMIEKNFGLDYSYPTTQIEHYDQLSYYFDSIRRINVIFIDFCRDIWSYISMEYFKQRLNEGEVGSSTMPHKVNPIDFENAEGNFLIANAILDFFSNKLPISRLQRDLTDSTILRNVGVPLSHTIIAFESLKRGLTKLEVNEEKIKDDLMNCWEVLAEAVQTILRKESVEDAYEILKKFTRTNKRLTQDAYIEFVNSLEITEEHKKQLLLLTPKSYIGKLYHSNI